MIYLHNTCLGYQTTHAAYVTVHGRVNVAPARRNQRTMHAHTGTSVAVGVDAVSTALRRRQRVLLWALVPAYMARERDALKSSAALQSAAQQMIDMVR